MHIWNSNAICVSVKFLVIREIIKLEIAEKKIMFFFLRKKNFGLCFYWGGRKAYVYFLRKFSSQV